MGVDHGWAKLFLSWFDHWLRGERSGVVDMPKVQLFVAGLGWVSGDSWPLTGTHFTNYYLTSDSGTSPAPTARTLSTTPGGDRGTDSYTYDPSLPVASRGGTYDATAARDQRPIEVRRDVLTYTTPPLEAPVTIAGPVDVVLYISSSARDTDFMVKLVDVYPDGKAINLADDAFRVRYREGFDKAALMEPGNVYKITLSNMVTARRFPALHRIRLQISSSNFPVYERNLNTGGNNYDETSWVVAENSIHHGPEAPSHVVLPVQADF
jgi:putative CocE/NonD family hydrolase